MEAFGVDVVVNNEGHGTFGPFETFGLGAG
jgi:hypothetical protein